jgi:hypothetical protein
VQPHSTSTEYGASHERSPSEWALFAATLPSTKKKRKRASPSDVETTSEIMGVFPQPQATVSASVEVTATAAASDSGTSWQGEVYVDSGAALSIISGELAARLRAPIEPSGITNPDSFLKTVSGEFMKVTGMTTVRLLMEDEVVVQWKCLVVPAFEQGILLGVDFLKGEKASMDFNACTLSFPGQPTIRLGTTAKEQGQIGVETSVRIPARTRVITRALPLHGLPSWCTRRHAVETMAHAVEARLYADLKQTTDAMLARSWGVFVDGTMPIQLVNPLYEDIWVKAGQPVGGVHHRPGTPDPGKR